MGDRLSLKEIKEKLELMSLEDTVVYLNQIKDEYGSSVEKLADKYNKKRQKYYAELDRLEAMSQFEKEAYSKGFNYVAGIDEAGRGPLAGPVVAACVMLPKGIIIEKINDSKKLSEKERDRIYEIIKKEAITYGLGIVEPKYIDEYNILNATKKAMKLAIGAMKIEPDMLLIDAVKLEDIDIKQNAIIKGDSLSVSIAAASILAKVTRDRLIVNLDEKYPQYGFAKHKGYGTKEHTDAIKRYGLCEIHRRSFTKNFVSQKEK